MTPRIIFEDESIMVIDKPAGMVVNKSDSSRYVETVQEWAEKHLTIDSEHMTEKGSEFAERGGIVHRLDKETSGVLVIAKNEATFTKLQSQWKSREVKKTYITLVHGEVTPAEGEINVSIGRLPWNRTKFGVLAEGRESSSKYKVISNYKFKILNSKGKETDGFEILSLVEIYPATGRTHQIRVHMKHIGHPVFADELYAGRKTARADRKLIFRHFLHATKLIFKHPKTGESMTFASPLPKELSDFLDSLENNPINN